MSNPITTETIIRIWPKHTQMGGGTAGKTEAKESNEGFSGEAAFKRTPPSRSYTSVSSHWAEQSSGWVKAA